MKILILRKKIIIQLSISLALAAILGFGIYYVLSQKKEIKAEVSKIESGAMQIKSQIMDLQNEASETKKYKEIWKTISKNKKSTQGIKVDDMNDLLKKIADKYSVSKSKIQVILPEILSNGVFNRKTVQMNYSTATLNFESVNDTRALLFLSEFINALPGYIIIKSLELTKKVSSYSYQDLIDISIGKNTNTLVVVKIDFYWYSYKEKDPAKEVSKKDPGTTKSDTGDNDATKKESANTN